MELRKSSFSLFLCQKLPLVAACTFANQWPPRLTGVFFKVPPRDNLDKVPLGASSASMYPGYSPADHIYGEAAQEFGEHAAELRRKGEDLKLDPHGPQYMVGQNKRRRLSQEPGTVPGASVSSTIAHNGSGDDREGEPMEGVEQSADVSQYFVIDSEPTPVTDLGEAQKQKNKANDKAKRRVSFKEEHEAGPSSINSSDAPKAKKAKVNSIEPSAAGISGPVIQEDDISVEVAERLKAKEEKRKRKEGKKRKRESAGSLDIQPQSTTIPADGHIETETSLMEKPKKKLHKKDQTEVFEAIDSPAKARDDKLLAKDKKKKKGASHADEQESAVSAVAGSEKPKKKREQDTTPLG
jgi:hypothetical protein